jgi:hypothetical protein
VCKRTSKAKTLVPCSPPNPVLLFTSHILNANLVGISRILIVPRCFLARRRRTINEVDSRRTKYRYLARPSTHKITILSVQLFQMSVIPHACFLHDDHAVDAKRQNGEMQYLHAREDLLVQIRESGSKRAREVVEPVEKGPVYNNATV